MLICTSPLQHLLIVCIIRGQISAGERSRSGRTFVITAQERDRGVVPQTLHVIIRFFPHVVHELIVRWIHSASELEVLPDQNAQL